MSKILIIEDDQVVANIYRNKLAVEGHQVECAPDGETGLEVMKSFQPEALILDLMLPGISGIDVLKHRDSVCHGPSQRRRYSIRTAQSK